MYYSNYDDYMRTVLGYSVNDNNTYQIYNDFEMQNNSNISDLEELYPDIYKKINPIVCRACDNNIAPVTKELLDNLTMQITDEVENNIDMTKINLNVELSRDESKRVENRNIKEPIREDRNRQSNPLLRDLIRILLLNNFIGKNRPPYRPPMPPPPRPPYPGGPVRPPQPREYYRI